MSSPRSTSRGHCHAELTRGRRVGSPGVRFSPRTGSPPPGANRSRTFVPTMPARIVHHEGRRGRVPSLRSRVRRRPMPAPRPELASPAVSETDFVNAHGLTETSSTVAPRPDDHRLAITATTPVGTARLSSVGPVPDRSADRDEPAPTSASTRPVRSRLGRRWVRYADVDRRPTPPAGSTPATAAG
jgi:hypothetical protein